MTAGIIDTHAHVQFGDFDQDRDAVLHRARAAGIEAIVLIGIDEASVAGAIALAERHDWLYATAGLHPHDAGRWSPATAAMLRSAATHPCVVALGEMGLDYYRMRWPREQQVAAFEGQLALAAELDVPVVVHARQAADDAAAILSAWAGGLPAAHRRPLGVLHCFEGPLDLAERYAALGFMVSVPGPVTYPNADERRSVARGLPLEAMVVETDCPYLPPQQHRGQRNEPAYLAETVAAIAELRGTDAAAVASVTTTNAVRLFRLPVTAAEIRP